MFSLRKWLYKPKRTDSSLLAQFYYADESLCDIATELDSFDGRREPERCARLVGQLRHCQDSVLQYIQRIMDEAIPHQRASRDFRVKYPDDLIQEGLSGQLWFGAECLAAGSSILNREVESASMRPLARSLTKQLDSLRATLRDLCLSRSGATGSLQAYSDKIREGLVSFDRLFADFELSYVSAMVPVKTMKDYEMSQDVAVMFSEAVDRALKRGLITRESLDNCDPALMFTIPRLAIVTGLVMTADGPLNPDVPSLSMSDMFRPFQTLLRKIRDLLRSLKDDELYMLERTLCSLDDPRIHSRATGDAVPSTARDCEPSSVSIRRRAAHVAEAASNINGGPCSHCRCPDSDHGSGGRLLEVVDPAADVCPSSVAAALLDEPLGSNGGDQRRGWPEVTSATSALPVDSFPARRSVSIQTEQRGSSGDNQATSRNGNARCRHHHCVGSGAAAATAASEDAPSANAAPTVQFAFWLPDRTDSRRVTVERSISYEGGGTGGGGNAASRPRPGARDGAMAEHREDVASWSTECSVCGDAVSSGQSSLCSFADDDASATDEDGSCSSSVAGQATESLASDAVAAAERGAVATRDHSKNSEPTVTAAVDGRSVARINSSELIHKLFVCISGVADQLQTNFASDLRGILKYVFDIHTSCADDDDDDDGAATCSSSALMTLCPQAGNPPTRQRRSRSSTARSPPTSTGDAQQSPPPWVPDELHPQCSACKIPFTFVRRRHHCRNCGQIFCSSCSCNWAPLPNYGYDKPVRVCTTCFVYHVDPFAMDPSVAAASAASSVSAVVGRTTAAAGT